MTIWMWKPCNYSESDMQAASLTASCLYGNLLVLAEFLFYFHLCCSMDGFVVMVLASSRQLLCSDIVYVLDLQDRQFTSFGLVQTKPVQSKTAGRWSSPVQPSGRTGLDWALPQTGSIRTGGIIERTAIQSSRLFLFTKLQYKHVLILKSSTLIKFYRNQSLSWKYYMIRKILH